MQLALPCVPANLLWLGKYENTIHLQTRVYQNKRRHGRFGGRGPRLTLRSRILRWK